MGTRRQSLGMSRGIVCKQSKMAPKYPDEVDVFTVPHSRMKQLVQKYFDMVFYIFDVLFLFFHRIRYGLILSDIIVERKFSTVINCWRWRTWSRVVKPMVVVICSFFLTESFSASVEDDPVAVYSAQEMSFSCRFSQSCPQLVEVAQRLCIRYCVHIDIFIFKGFVYQLPRCCVHDEHVGKSAAYF